ncbi:MAG: hypothetical protein WDO16_18560 [Bacteroidota bacterium]
MKLRTFLAVAAISIFAACETPYQATDTTTVVVVPDETQRAFAEQYPNGVNVVWTNYDPDVVVLNDWDLTGWQAMDASDYVVRFDMDNENYYAWYDSDGTWVGTAYVVKDYTKLPVGVNTTINNMYPTYSIASANREFYKEKVAYEVVLKKDDTRVILLLDNDGNILKQKTKMP